MTGIDRQALRSKAERLIAEAEALAPVDPGRLRAAATLGCGCGRCTGRPDWGDGQLPPHIERPVHAPPSAPVRVREPAQCPVCESPVAECVSPCVEAIKRELNEQYPVQIRTNFDGTPDHDTPDHNLREVVRGTKGKR